MHRSTVFFAALSAILAVTTVFVTYRLIAASDGITIPQVGGSSIQLGLGQVAGENQSGSYESGSVLVWNTDAAAISFEQNAFERRPIASITKLMTAMVAMDHGINWDHLTTIEREEYVQGGRLLMHPGEEVSMRDLFHASLLGSANNATLAYVRELGIDREEFVQEMNRKAIELGLEQTEFSDVTGLDPGNISTAYEVARLAEHAFSFYPEIADASSRKEYTFSFAGSDREHTMHNTNKLISQGDDQFLGSKTGFLYEALYCLVVQGSGEMAHKIVVVLGSPSESINLAEVNRAMVAPLP